MPSRIILPASGSATSFLVPSNNLQLEANTERNSISSGYTLIKKFKIGTPGIILLEFEYKTNATSFDLILSQSNNDTFSGFDNTNYKIPISTSSSYSKISVYVPIYGNKNLCLFAHSNTNGSPLYVKNVKIYFDYYNDSSNAVITN